MEKIEKNAKKIVQKVKTLYGNSPDVNSRIINIKGKNVGIIFLESSSQASTVSDFIIKGTLYTKENKRLGYLMEDYTAAGRNMTYSVFKKMAESLFNESNPP